MASWSEVASDSLGPGDRIDAEYYDASLLKLEDDLRKSGLPLVPLGRVIKDGYRVVYENTEVVTAPENEQDYVHFLQAANISRRLPVINRDGIGWVTRRDWERYPKGRIRPGELLIEVKGKAEKVAMVPEDVASETLVTGTLFKATVDDSQVRAEYVVAYLLSKYGRGLRQRCLTNTLIGYVSKPELYSIPLVLPENNEQDEIVRLIGKCTFEENESHRLYDEAEQMLLNMLPLSVTTDHGEDLSYVVRSDLVDSVNRIDAEFFQPEKWIILDALQSASGAVLEDYYGYQHLPWDPRTAGEIKVRNFDLADAFVPFLDDSKDSVSPVDVGSLKKQFQFGDVLISRLRSYLRQVAIGLVDDNILSVASTEFIVLRAVTKPRAVLSPETVLLYLRCSPIQTVLKWSQDGSNHPRFDPRAILRLPIPHSLIEADTILMERVRESTRRLRAAEMALLEATTMVEDLIKQGPARGRSA